MNRNLLHKLLLARRLHELARENLSSANDLSLGIGVNLLQDAVEAFLLAVAEYVNAGIQSGTHFDRYFELINAKISPKELPFRSRLIALNKLRVNSKHYGLAPAQTETDGLVLTVREFFDEVTRSVLGLSFSTVSLIDLVRDRPAKEFLRAAEECFRAGKFADCLVNCRKAVFLEIEQFYDVARFGGATEPGGLGLLALRNRAPFYARNKEYVDKYVRDATEYIVLDHDDVELELVKSGMDSVSFWNMWRLTPEVYRPHREAEWVVKRDLSKLDDEGLQERAEYVLTTTVNLFVAADQKRAGIRSPGHRKYYVTLRQDRVPVYEKADRNSAVVATTPAGVTELFVDFTVPALSGDGTFWHVAHTGDGWSIWGYLPDDAIQG